MRYLGAISSNSQKWYSEEHVVESCFLVYKRFALKLDEDLAKLTTTVLYKNFDLPTPIGV